MKNQTLNRSRTWFSRGKNWISLVKRSTNSDHRIGGWMRDMADMADAIVAFPRRCLQWRVIVTLHPLAPFHPKPVYTRGSGAHGRGAASHISRLIVSICRAPSIRQFRHWTVSRPKRVGGRPGNRDIIAAGVEDDRHFSLSSLVRSLQPANCWYYDRECREIRGDWRGEIVDKSGWILKQIVGGWIRDEFSENRTQQLSFE